MILSQLRGAVIVSCQADPGNPLREPEIMAAMARAAEMGGARGIRAEGVRDVAAIRSACGLPILGIRKVPQPTGRVFITPSFEDAKALVAAGADMVAIDGTRRPRPGGEQLGDLIRRVHEELGVPVIADVDSVEAGVSAAEAGADMVATTLSGYTTAGEPPDEPDIELVGQLVAVQPLPVVAEGRIWSSEHVRASFAAGAYAIVIGTAITNPMLVTQRLVAAAPQGNRTE